MAAVADDEGPLVREFARSVLPLLDGTRSFERRSSAGAAQVFDPGDLDAAPGLPDGDQGIVIEGPRPASSSTGTRRNERASRIAEINFKEHREALRTPLPRPTAGRIAQLAAQRNSVRAFASAAITSDQLSALLHAAYGVVEVAPLGTGGGFLRRSVPSAGGLYPLELYPMVRRVEGVTEGIHHFDARGDALELVRPGDWRAAAAEVFYTWPFVVEANGTGLLRGDLRTLPEGWTAGLSLHSARGGSRCPEPLSRSRGVGAGNALHGRLSRRGTHPFAWPRRTP